MKQATAFLAALALLMPAFAFAAPFEPKDAQVGQLTALAAAIEAQAQALENGTAMGCAIEISKPTVQLNEPFYFAWGSVGTESPGDDPNRSVMYPNGEENMSLNKAGTWVFNLIFYAKSGATTTCSAAVKVVGTDVL